MRHDLSLTRGMQPTRCRILGHWHRVLGLQRQSPRSWHRDRIYEELRERRTAKTSLQKLSETSDVFFSISRAQYDGYPIRPLPAFVFSQVPVYLYMLAKYTSRWTFYRMVAVLCKVARYDLVREVVNPSKDHKLDEVASRHNIDLRRFHRVGRWLRKVWPLLP